MSLNIEEREAALCELRKLSENEFSKKVLIPLYTALGFFDITHTHGEDEFGKDIIFSDKNKFGETVYYTSLVKQGDISGDTASSKTIANILAQAREALMMPFSDRHDGYVEKLVSRLFIVTSGNITGKARRVITEALRRGGLVGDVRFLDGDQVISLIEQVDPEIVRTWIRQNIVTEWVTLPIIGDYYPAIRLYIRHQERTDTHIIVAGFDTGASLSFISAEYLESLGFNLGGVERVSSLIVGVSMHHLYRYCRSTFNVSLDGKTFRRLPLNVVWNWSNSPFTKVNPSRVCYLGRDIPKLLKARIEIDFGDIKKGPHFR